MNLVNETKLYRLIGKTIREIRRSEKLTQAELAKILNLTRTSITNIEQGTQKLPLHILYRFCLRFRLSIDEILPDPQSVANELPEAPENIVISTATNEAVSVSKETAELIEILKQSTINKT